MKTKIKHKTPTIKDKTALELILEIEDSVVRARFFEELLHRSKNNSLPPESVNEALNKRYSNVGHCITACFTWTESIYGEQYWSPLSDLEIFNRYEDT